MSVQLAFSLPNDFQTMLEDCMRCNPNKFDRMTPVDLDNLPPVDQNTWFACHKDNKVYYFPLCESENWDRTGMSQRVRGGMRGFEELGWKTYKIQ